MSSNLLDGVRPERNISRIIDDKHHWYISWLSHKNGTAKKGERKHKTAKEPRRGNAKQLKTKTGNTITNVASLISKLEQWV